MLRQIVERLDTEIATRMDEIETIGGAVLDLHGDLDNQIAEYDYSAVEQSVASLRGMVDMETVLPAIDTVLLLTALRDDEPVPDLTLPLSAFEDGDSGEHPRLTQEDLEPRLQSGSGTGGPALGRDLGRRGLGGLRRTGLPAGRAPSGSRAGSDQGPCPPGGGSYRGDRRPHR
ncbi:hypothetical protein [Streptomyces sp.]|uniref:hypothetical protein n=1 Tax=Streptomyces sp. TaxID=1931 RepID=UPI0025D4A23D|nr:hypothetical protein [Streptomyces sp.]